MTKFKVGDKVRATRRDSDFYSFGDIGVLVMFDGTMMCDFNGHGNSNVVGDGIWYVSDCNMELFKPEPKPKKHHIWVVEELVPKGSKHVWEEGRSYRTRSIAREMLTRQRRLWPSFKFRIRKYVRVEK